MQTLKPLILVIRRAKLLCRCFFDRLSLTSIKCSEIDPTEAVVWALRAANKQKWDADHETVSSTMGKISREVEGDRHYHTGKDQSWGHRVYLFSIKSQFCLSLRLGPWCCNAAVHRPPSLQPNNWGFFCSGRIIWVDGRWGWVEAVFVSLSVSIPFSLLHPRPSTICSSQPGFYPPAGRPLLHPGSTTLHPHAKSLIYSFMLVVQMMSSYVFPWHSKLYTSRHPAEGWRI